MKESPARAMGILQASFGMIVLMLAAGAPSPIQGASRTGAQHAVDGVALIELFTSEGCSSCPPADALLEQLVREAESDGRRVYGLSFHVDYWDRLGWKDRFSNAVYTRRQGEYAKRLGLRSIYTPQMVVNGTREFVGSDATEARAAIEASLSRPSQVTPGLSVTTSNDAIRARCTVEHAPGGAVLTVAWIQSRAVSSPDRGENRGRKLRHVNVVRDLQTIELRPGFDDVIQLHRSGVEDGKVIAWIQEAKAGPVIGVAARSVTVPNAAPAAGR